MLLNSNHNGCLVARFVKLQTGSNWYLIINQSNSSNTLYPNSNFEFSLLVILNILTGILCFFWMEYIYVFSFDIGELKDFPNDHRLQIIRKTKKRSPMEEKIMILIYIHTVLIHQNNYILINLIFTMKTFCLI